MDQDISERNLNFHKPIIREVFPNMDVEIIDAVLKEAGSLELTIDHLLEVQKNESQKSFKGSQFPASRDAAHSSSHVKKGNWSQAVLSPLPENFLRLKSDQDDLDEYACMLQNEEFLNELRFNQEFLSTLEKEQGRFQDEKFEDKLKRFMQFSFSKGVLKNFFQHWKRNKGKKLKDPKKMNG